MAPRSSMPLSVWWSAIAFVLISGGSLSFTRSFRPASSWPPMNHSMSPAFTPYSSFKKPRIHTAAVIEYSGAPTFLPLKSSGRLIPASRSEHPFHVARLHAVFVVQEAADPHRRRDRIFRRADFFAFEVFRPLDPRLRVDEDARMAEKTRREDGDGDEGGAAAADHRDVIGKRHLRGVELAKIAHAPEDLLRLQRNIIQPDAFRLDFAGLQRLGAVINPARDGQM